MQPKRDGPRKTAQQAAADAAAAAAAARREEARLGLGLGLGLGLRLGLRLRLRLRLALGLGLGLGLGLPPAVRNLAASLLCLAVGLEMSASSSSVCSCFSCCLIDFLPRSSCSSSASSPSSTPSPPVLSLRPFFSAAASGGAAWPDWPISRCRKSRSTASSTNTSPPRSKRTLPGFTGLTRLLSSCSAISTLFGPRRASAPRSDANRSNITRSRPSKPIGRFSPCWSASRSRSSRWRVVCAALTAPGSGIWLGGIACGEKAGWCRIGGPGAW